MARKTEYGWAIAGAGDFGLYAGWWTRRNDAIGEHVSQMTGIGVHCVGGRLSREQAAEWLKRKRNGDRAVRVKLSYQI